MLRGYTLYECEIEPTVNCFAVSVSRGRARINLRVLQNFTKKIDHVNNIICRKISKQQEQE